MDLIREQGLLRKLNEESAAMEKPLRMMHMYANRCNARWPEHQQWDAPHVHAPATFSSSVSGGQATAFRVEVVNQLKAGKYAIQVMVGDDYVRMSEVREPFCLWSADPWKIIQEAAPVRAESLDRVEGVPLGPRLLMALVNAVEALGGEGAAQHLHVVLHCNEAQEDAVVADLRARRFCGLPRENVIVVVQRRRLGYVFDKEQQRFVRQLASPLKQAGSGYCMMQLTWPGEAFVLAGSGDGDRQYIAVSVLDYLLKRGATWLVTRRLRDLSLYRPETTLDLDSLAQVLYLSDQQGANMAVHVDPFPSVTGLGGVEGLVMAHKNHWGDKAGRDALHRTPVVEVKGNDLSTPRMANIASEVKHKGKSKLHISSRRYMFSIATLKALITTPAVFRPSLDMVSDLAYVVFDAADLTATPTAHCVALLNRTPAKSFTSPAELEEVISAVHAQDSSAPFRRLLGSTTTAAAPGAVARRGGVHAPGGAGQRDQAADAAGGPRPRLSGAGGHSHKQPRPQKPSNGQLIVILVTDNDATHLAVQLSLSVMRPGKDLVVFVTVVNGELAEPGGRELCRKYEALAKTTLTETWVEVLVKGSMPLVETLEQFVDDIGGDLVVFGSQGLAQGANAVTIGSVSLSLIKSIRQPVIMVKANAKNAAIAWDKDKLKCMVQVDHTSRPLLKYVSAKLLSAVRYDRLYLARGGATDKSHQESVTSRRLLENFGDIAAGFHYTPIKRPLDGLFEEEGCKVADVEKVHIMAVQAPLGRAVPDSIIKLIKNTRSAVLIYKSNDAW